MNDADDRLAALSPAKRALLERRLAAATPPRAAERIAIVSAGCRFPGGATSPQAYWQLLIDGCDAVADVPPARWNAAALFDADPLAPHRIQSRCGAFLDDVDRFDAAFFGISPREAATMDPQQRLLLEVAWEALEDAGQAAGPAGRQPHRRVRRHHAAATTRSSHARRARRASTPTRAPATRTASRPTALSYVLDLHGPSLAVDTACSSSLVAVHLACQSLRRGECDLALAGGVNLMLLAGVTIALLAGCGCCRRTAAARRFDAARRWLSCAAKAAASSC